MKKPLHSGGSTPKRIILLVAVLVMGLGLRVANLADISNSPFFTRPVSDGQAYDRWAQAITGRADSPEQAAAVNEPFYQDPLYPYFLAGIYTLFGHSYWAVYVIQLVLAMMLLWLVYDTARRLFDWRAGIAAASIAAIYKPFIFYESQIEKTALAVFLTALLLWLFVKASSIRPQASSHKLQTRHLFWPLASGVALGLAALTRANTLIFAPLLPLAYLLNAPRSHKQRSAPASGSSQLVPALASVIGVLLVIAPVSIRNSLLTHEFTLTTTQAGQNLYIGNSPYNSTGQYQAPPWVRAMPEFEQQDFAGHARSTTQRDLTPGQVSRFYVRTALNWATSHGRDFATLLWRKTVLYFNNFEVPDNQDIYFFSRYSWVLRLPLLSFGLVFGLGLAAMLLAARGLGRLSLVVFYFVYAASVVAFFVLARYRLPAIPALLPFAGAMLPWLADSYLARPSPHASRPLFPPRLAGGIALILAAAAPTFYPVFIGKGNAKAAQCLTYLAAALYREGDTTGAIRTFEEALAEEPGHAGASRNLGIIMMNRNELARALELFSDATRADSADPANHLQLGKLYARQGQTDMARAEFRRATALAPDRVEPRFELATSLQLADSHALALAQYDTIMRLAPDNPVARHNSAVCLYDLDRLDEARARLEEARRLGGTVNPRFDSLLNFGRPREP